LHAAWLNAVDSMQREEMEPYWMQWILCSMIECSGFIQHDWIQWMLCSMAQSIPIECSGFHAASLNSEYSMHCGAMDPDCMQWSPCSEVQFIQIEWSAFYAAWPNASRLNAVDSMHCDWMQCTPCSVVKCIPMNAVDSMHCVKIQLIPFSVKKWKSIECSGFYAAWWNAVDFMQHGPKHPDWMLWIPCIVIEFILLNAAW
jgi:hypothetical protein